MAVGHLRVSNIPQMNANEFNRQYEDFLGRPLKNFGFQTHGHSLSYTRHHTVLALLRLQHKFSGLTQTTHFLLCVRHTFLRTLEKEPAVKFLREPSEYPFKLPISRLHTEMLRTWHYQPVNLGPREYDSVAFGGLNDASTILSGMREKILGPGLAWIAFLNPLEALTQIKQHGEDAYCERIWIEDYNAFETASHSSNIPLARRKP